MASPWTRYLHEAIVWLGNAWYKTFVRPLLFAISRKDAERGHEIGILALRAIGANSPLFWLVSLICTVRDLRLAQVVCRKDYHTPVGMAAGFDKHAEAMAGLEACGFGFIEVGGFTSEKQPGNPRPRMFRLADDEALINRMGFNNPGARQAGMELRYGDLPSVPLGINVGKGKDTPLERAAGDYAQVIVELYGRGHYFAVNISSPNTPGLRLLQDKAYLRGFLRAVLDAAEKRRRQLGWRASPIFVKIAPDLANEQLDDLIAICLEVGVDDLIAVNTTTSREGIVTKIDEAGGLSGPPIRERALAVVRYIKARVPDEFVIIGVGGIATAKDAYEMLKAGAWLVQLLTAFVYQGPFVATRINLGLLRLMERDGYTHVSELRKGGSIRSVR